MKQLIIIIFSLITFISCENEQKEIVLTDVSHPGKSLMEMNCNTCHSSTSAENSRIAPPMIAIKKKYLEPGISKHDFILSIQNWVEHPSEDISKMPDAIKKYGIMAKINYPKESIEQIADYIFSNEIEKPEWFKENGKNQLKKNSKQTNSESYSETGMKYALATKTQLGKKLMGAIQNKGLIGAVTFCNIKALAITDSMGMTNNANIKRVSDKPRNPNNAANLKEQKYIATFKELLANNKELKPLIKESEETINFYFPITTNAMCLKCHGNLEQELKFSTYEKIKELYPEDEAIGYDTDQVRGIWSINFDK